MTSVLTSDLPNDPEALHALVADLQAEVARKEAEVERLTSAGAAAEAEIKRLSDIIAALQRHRFGARSEKLSEDQLDLAFEETEAALSFVETGLEELKPRPRSSAPRKTNRGRLPAALVLDVDHLLDACQVAFTSASGP